MAPDIVQERHIVVVTADAGRHATEEYMALDNDRHAHATPGRAAVALC